MDIQDVIEVADRLILEHREKSLSNLEKEIIRGTLKDCEYEQISLKTNHTLNYVRTVGAKLWSELSEVLDTDINKRNFKIVVEKLDIDHHKDNFDSAFESATTSSDSAFDSPTIQNSESATIQNVVFNNYSPPRSPEKKASEPENISSHKNVETLPEYFNCYGREEELKTLQKWILEDGDRLISILGFPGIGKTTLSLKLAEQMKSHFDVILYRNLSASPTLHILLMDILESLSYKTDNSYILDKQLSRLTKALHRQNCLFIFDDFHHLFAPNELSGTYLKEQGKFQRLFETIVTRSHQSCLLLCSREKPKEIDQWEGGTSPIHSLELKGSKEVAIALFQEKQLNDETNWPAIIDDWQGHPLQLQEISILIRDIFGGNVSQFSEYSAHFVGNNLKEKIEQHLERLSEFERDIILAFDGKNDSLPIGKLMTKSGLIPAEFFNVVQSLQRRFCLETQQKERIKHFSLPHILQNYLQLNPLE